jgi:hypothetical protein
MVVWKRIVAVALTLLWSGVASAQANADPVGEKPEFGKDLPFGPWRVDLGAQLRLRYEYDDQLTIKGYVPGSRDSFLLERLMLNATARYGKDFRIAVQLRDAHAVGSSFRDADFPQSNPIHDSLDVRQAFVEWLHIEGTPMGIKLGRQQISYGDQRLFGPGLWGNTGRYAWDAAMLKVDTLWYDIDLWAGRPIENRPERWPDTAASGPTAMVGYLQFKRLPMRVDLFHAVKFDGSGSVKGEAGTGNLRSHSSGFQLEGSVRDRFDYSATFVYQFGQYGTDTIRAYGFNAKISARLADTWKPVITTQLTWGSGDSNPRDGVHGTFDGVFGGADIMFYGYQNIFYWPNLHDHELDFDLSPHPRLSFRAEYHYMTLDQSVDAWYSTGLKPVRIDQSGASGSDLGQELDAKVIWKARDGIELLMAGGHFFPGGFVRATGAAPSANWFGTQLAYGF